MDIVDAVDAFLNQPIAYHEAGHAVMATARGWTVLLVTIIPVGGRLGRCDVDGNPRCADTAWGGPVAQGICSDNRDLLLTHPYRAKDRADALDYSGNDADVCESHLEVVRALLTEPLHRRQLKAVADELLETEMLAGDRVRELIATQLRRRDKA